MKIIRSLIAGITASAVFSWDPKSDPLAAAPTVKVALKTRGTLTAHTLNFNP